MMLGCSQGQAKVAPSSLTFPGATVGLPSTKELVVTNNASNGDLTLSSTQITGADARCSPTGSRTARRWCWARASRPPWPWTFLPTATGARTATLEVTHTGAGSPLAVALSATATAAGGTTDRRSAGRCSRERA